MEPVENLNNKIKQLQKEISEIQKECKHESEELIFKESTSLMWVCKRCRKDLRWPTPKEQEGFCSQ